MPPSRYLLVDGHSIIFHWPELRQLHQTHSRLARENLRKVLDQLHDTGTWKITLVFDGKSAEKIPQNPARMLVLYSQDGESADSIIERIVGQQENRSNIWVVTADEAERQTIEALGAFTYTPEWLKAEIEQNTSSLSDQLKKIHQREKW